jgi:hypothetical protein
MREVLIQRSDSDYDFRAAAPARNLIDSLPAGRSGQPESEGQDVNPSDRYSGDAVGQPHASAQKGPQRSSARLYRATKRRHLLVI